MKTFKQFITEQEHPMIDVDGVMKHRNNSEGRPIHPTNEGIRNFHRWFGDSKAVDQHGRPQVTYHGTMKDFSAFDKNRYGTMDHGTVGHGIYTSGNKGIANNYANKVIGNTKFHEGGNVKPVYMKTHNPISFDGAMKVKMDISKERLDKGESYASLEQHIGRYTTEKLKSMGHDGVSPTHGEWEGVGDSWTAFHPHQVKSAIGNNGNFSKDSEHIHEAYEYE